MREAFTFYRSYYEAAKQIDDPAERLKALEAIMEFALDETEPDEISGTAKAIFIMAKPTIDKSLSQSEYGKKGGAPKGNQNAKKTTQNNPKQPPLFLKNNPPCLNKTSNEHEHKDKHEDNNKELYAGKTTPELESAITDWLKYKAERREGYKDTGMKSFITQVLNKSNEYGPDKVAEVIRKSMGSNYKGVVWDWLNKASPPTKNKFNNFDQRRYDFAALEKEAT